MTAYIVAQTRITDPERFGAYGSSVGAIVEKYKGSYVVVGGDPEILEGEDDGRRLVILSFESREQARRFWNSAEYAEAKKGREGAAVMTAIVVDGMT